VKASLWVLIKSKGPNRTARTAFGPQSPTVAKSRRRQCETSRLGAASAPTGECNLDDRDLAQMKAFPGCRCIQDTRRC